jgi:excisionase family DNA binding protein
VSFASIWIKDADVTTEAITERRRAVEARLLNVEEVQARLNCGRSTVFELIKARHLRSVKVGRRRLVSEASLAEFIEHLDKQAGA